VELPPIVDSDWVLAHRSEVVLADVRWYLDGRSGRAAYERSHIPGAIFVDLERDLSGPGVPSDGRHPFPTPEAFAGALGRLGIALDDPVIGYDDSGGGTAGRLVWMLRIVGHPAALLDGGLHAWPEPPESGAGATRFPVVVPARPWPVERFANHDEVATAARAGDAVVLDARSAPRFAGEDATIDPRPGHIPGAANVHWAANVDPVTCRFREDAELRELYAARGIDESSDVICYCGSGVSACADLLALERLGIGHTRLYVPSWSGWSADPSRPAATCGVSPWSEQ
jgi:thiosulfate/3-mercaptopyruvate sulfurtransferase